ETDPKRRRLAGRLLRMKRVASSQQAKGDGGGKQTHDTLRCSEDLVFAVSSLLTWLPACLTFGHVVEFARAECENRLGKHRTLGAPSSDEPHMSASIQDILRPLKPHWDRIIRRPMPRPEVAKLEKQVGPPMPQPLRDYLMEIGLFQDLTHWGVSAIEVYESPEDFVAARRFLSDLLPPEGQGLFPFGGDGAGNVFCLPTAKSTPCRIQFVDHETRKIAQKKDFTVWLQEVVAKVLRGIRRRAPNEHKVWAVEFSFSDTDYRDLVKVLRSAGKFKEIDRAWKKTKPTHGVRVAERLIEFNGERIKVQQMECAAWHGPLLS